MEDLLGIGFGFVIFLLIIYLGVWGLYAFFTFLPWPPIF